MITSIAAWLLTYLIHSTILIGLVALLVAALRVRGGAAEVAWRIALVGALVTASTTSFFERAPSAARLELEPVATTGVNDSKPAAEPRRLDERSQRTPSSDESSWSRLSPSRPAAPQPEAATAPPSTPPTPTWSWSDWLVAIVAAISGGSLLLHGVRRAALAGRLHRRRELTHGPLVDALARLSRRAGLRRGVRLTICDRLTVPIAFGILRPEISIPERCLDLAPAAAEAMLAHELAHLRRGDPLRLAVFVLIERVLAFQPLNRFARRRWQEAAEFRCDEHAAGLVGSGVPLARCLTDVAGWLTERPRRIAPVLRMASDRSTLSRRIETLLAGRPARGARPLGVAAIVIGLGLVLLAPGVGVGAGERPTSPNDDVVRGPAVDDEPSGLPAAIESLDRELTALEREVDALRASITAAGLQGEVGGLLERMTAQCERLRLRRRSLAESARAERSPKGAKR